MALQQWLRLFGGMNSVFLQPALFYHALKEKREQRHLFVVGYLTELLFEQAGILLPVIGGTLLDTHSPDIVIIELGGNDGLRGLSPVAMANNLTQMIEKSRAANATPVLLGMRIPPNYGQQYTRLATQPADFSIP